MFKFTCFLNTFRLLVHAGLKAEFVFCFFLANMDHNHDIVESSRTDTEPCGEIVFLIVVSKVKNEL